LQCDNGCFSSFPAGCARQVEEETEGKERASTKKKTTKCLPSYGYVKQKRSEKVLPLAVVFVEVPFSELCLKLENSTTQVLVTGGGGFLGRYLVSKLQKKRILNEHLVESITVLDCRGEQTQEDCGPSIKLFPNAPTPAGAVKVENWTANITDKKAIREAMLACTGNKGLPQQFAVFHLASIMSGQGEEDFDKCVAVNIEGELSGPSGRVSTEDK